jgi:hypothetical protein
MRNAIKATNVHFTVSCGYNETICIAPADRIRAKRARANDICSRCCAKQFRVRRNEYMEEPIMIQSIKHEKTIPSGGLNGSRVGVQMNTKMYITDSKSDWMIPKHNSELL